MFCIRCGNRVEDTYSFCSRCGEKQDRAKDATKGTDRRIIDIAYYAFETFGIGGSVPKQYQRDVEALLARHEARIDQLREIAESCGSDKSPKALYVKSYAYAWAGATCRVEAIHALNEYLQGEMYSDVQNDFFESEGLLFRAQDGLRADALIYLGKAYEGEQEFENAIHAFSNALKLHPTLYGISIMISNAYYRMDCFEKALSILEEARENPLLKPRSWKSMYGGEFITEDETVVFDLAIDELKAKIELRKAGEYRIKAAQYKKSGDMDAAIEALRRNNDIVLSNLIVCEKTLKLMTGAGEDMLLRLVEYLKDAGRFDEARKEDRMLRSKYPEFFEKSKMTYAQRAAKEEYDFLREFLPELAPKSLNGYSRMKNANTEAYRMIRAAAEAIEPD